jgi:26S proteasome regulatory subunit N3
MEPRFTTRVLRTLTATRKKLNKESMKKILNEAYPKGCMFTCSTSVVWKADSVAKTGQSLIANPIFDSLPSAPAPTSTDESMQVDLASTPAPTTEGEDKEKDLEASKPSPRKYTAPVDGQTEDLILEGTAYLRLLLVLMNLDAGKVEEVSRSWPNCMGIAKVIGGQV